MHDELSRCIELERAARGSAAAEPPTPLPGSQAWRASVGQAAEYVTLFDLDLRITFSNRLQPGIPDAVGSSIIDWVEPNTLPMFLRTVAAVHVSGLPHCYEVRGAGPHGESVGYRSWVVSLSGQPEGTAFAAIAVDISHVGRVERELADQTGVLETLVRHAPDNIMVLDRDQRILFSNHLLDELMASNVLGKAAWSFLPEAYQALARDHQAGVFRTGEATEYEVPLVLDSKTRWYKTRAGPILRDGKVERILLISTDITEERGVQARVERERALLDALERVDRLILAASDVTPMIEGVLEELRQVLDAERTCLTFPCAPDAASFSVSHERRRDDATAQLLGRSLSVTADYRQHLEAALTGSGAVQWCVPDAADSDHPLGSHGVHSLLSMALRPQPGPAWLLSVQRRDTGACPAEERALFESLGLRIADGLKTLLAQRDLRQSEERFRTLVEHAPEAIIIFDVDAGRFSDVNGNAEKLFSMSREQLLRSHVIDLSPELQPDGRRSLDLIEEVCVEALAGGTPTFEWLYLDAHKKPVVCEVRLVQLPHQERRLIRGSVTEIGARKRAEEEHRALAAQLAQAQKMQALGQLTGGIAHDFNNLLTVIIGSLALMEAEGIDPVVAREMAQHADAAAQRAAALTQRLLAFSRRQPLRPQSIDLRTLLPSMEQLLRRTLPENIALSVAIEPYTFHCEADPVQLESAMLNLAINARDAMPRGGALRVVAKNAYVEPRSALEREGLSPGDYVLITISDTGSGMGPEVLSQAFEPFFTTKGVGQGSGLGLSMVYGFAKQSGGHVRISSRPEQGTEVQLHLPRSKRSASSPGLPPVATGQDGENRLLLVVEDDPGVRQLVCEMLRRLGYRTLAAEDGPSALKLLAGRKDVALLLTDMALPGGMSGAELVTMVRADMPTLPVLFMTGYSNDAVTNDHPATQDVRLLPKPFSKAALATAIREVLRDAGK